MRVRERVRGVVAVATVAVAAALLAGAAPGVAGAGVVGTIPVDPDRHVGGTFAGPGTRHWRVRLERGRYYALRAETDGFERVAVRSPVGSVVARFNISDPIGENDTGGRTFRAPVAGWYDVAVTLPARCYGGPCLGGGRGGDYLLAVGLDCPGDAATRCAIAPGRPLYGLRANYRFDSDWFRVTLRAGATYRLSVPAESGSSVLAGVADARGVAVTAGDAWAGHPITFGVPATGVYYVVASAGTALGQYDLSLAVAR